MIFPLSSDMTATALKASEFKTKRAVVEEALRLLIKLKKQAEARALFGRVRWQESLEESRRDRL